MNRRTAIIFYVLSFYVAIQFIWWGYHIIDLTEEITAESQQITKRITMIAGEGAVFLILLLIGIWQIRRSVIRDIQLGKRQKNFLLSVTHELKTPLAANKLYLQTISKRDLTREQTVELVNKAIEENSRLGAMIDNILHASRLENNVAEFHPEEFDIAVFFNAIKDRFTNIHHSAQIEIEIQAPDTTIKADKSMMETIFSNLLDNAYKYAGKNDPITLYYYKESSTSILGVKDLGNGVEDKEKQEIFKRFYRIGNEDTRTQKGTGLGLFIVKQLVHKHDAQIVCKDNQPKGTNFEITL